VNEEWSNDQKKKIDCNNPKGFSQKAHCAGRKKRQAGKQTKSKPVKEFMEKQTIEERLQLFLEKNVPTSPSKWSYWVGQAKKKFDVYPSAYANGWAAKMYKGAGGKWKKESKK
jgi:hypothetical protein